MLGIFTWKIYTFSKKVDKLRVESWYVEKKVSKLNTKK